MPFKRLGSRFQQIEPKGLPGYGNMPRLSTGVTSARLAREMHVLVRRLATMALEDPEWYAVLDAVKAREIKLPDLLRAHKEDRLRQLRRRAKDPPISEATKEYLLTAPAYEIRLGLGQLQEMCRRRFGAKARLSDLLSGKTITLLLHRCEREGGRKTRRHPEGQPLKRNSVRRTMMVATSDLLKFHLGQFGRDQVFADVRFPAEKDTREADLNGNQVRAFLAACHNQPSEIASWLAPMVLLSMATSAEQGVLLRMNVGAVTLIYDTQAETYYGKVFVKGTKTKTRERTVDIDDVVCRALLPLSAGREANEPLFVCSGTPVSKDRLRYWFGLARKQVGLDHLRFHDLRHVFGAAAERAGVPLTIIQRCMGHEDPDQTRRYQLRQAALGKDHARAVARELGLHRQMEQSQAV